MMDKRTGKRVDHRAGPSHALGVLSVHLDGAPCAVGCPFCYLGARTNVVRLRPLGAAPRVHLAGAHVIDELVRGAERLDYAELAIALSEPSARGSWDEVRAALRRLVAAAAARQRPCAITTTPQIVVAEPTLLDGATRLNLSVDPWKLGGDAAALVSAVHQAATLARARGLAVIAIATLSTPSFAEALVVGLLETLVDLDALDGVALSALKPPPPFCDRAFWLSTLSRLRPLLDRALDRRLYLDCYVAARLLGIGGCPARPDLSPTRDGRIAFRSCVYASAPDTEIDRVEELSEALRRFVAPAVCPFDTRL